MRGQPALLITTLVQGRIIPARAGPTRRSSVLSAVFSDHPRSCGANPFVAVGDGQRGGSSLLVRGQHLDLAPGHLPLRIIPARAGPTSTRPSTHTVPTDHPRSCGANVDVSVSVDLVCGSSPLVRGQPDRKRPADMEQRIIPARAGPTTQARCRPPATSDHPRSCGANHRAATPGHRPCGSSPLVRGQLRRCFWSRGRVRIIPARAGPTRRAHIFKRLHTDHPRSCGANLSWVFRHFCHCGSSPLVRGQPVFVSTASMMHRIIPARAGPTLSIL